MKVENISQMKGGWFIGEFEPSVHKANFEVGVKKYTKGEFHAPHHHKIATEINYLISGAMRANGKLIHPGQIFTFEPYEIAECEFLEDCELLVVKTASVAGDKYEN
jgi:quercetin dioxygenase-like cupin family protein